MSAALSPSARAGFRVVGLISATSLMCGLASGSGWTQTCECLWW
jgi:hypothetical protein